MAENQRTPGGVAGGFVVPSLPSPAPSTTSTRSTTGLPHPRAHALRPGSAKEDKVRHFVTDRMGHVSRRFVKKFSLVEPGDDVVGYKSMGELCKDLEELINIIWLSGTPSLQIPYLLNIASEFNTWVKAFAPSPAATFSILHKLDHCFASLLSGKDFETKEPLPGFENGLRAGMSKTDMVRCKSTVQQTRIVIMDVMSEGPEEEEDVGEPKQQPTDEEAESDLDGPVDWSRAAFSGGGLEDEDEEPLYMDMARVYENTLVQLGEALIGGGVGDIQMSED